ACAVFVGEDDAGGGAVVGRVRVVTEPGDRRVHGKVAAGDAEPGQLGDQGGAQFLKVAGGDEMVPGLAYRLVALLVEHVPVLAEALGRLGDQQLHPQPQVFDET